MTNGRLPRAARAIRRDQPAQPPALPGWHIDWEGGRRGDETERYVLYLKDPA